MYCLYVYRPHSFVSIVHPVGCCQSELRLNIPVLKEMLLNLTLNWMYYVFLFNHAVCIFSTYIHISKSQQICEFIVYSFTFYDQGILFFLNAVPHYRILKNGQSTLMLCIISTNCTPHQQPYIKEHTSQKHQVGDTCSI